MKFLLYINIQTHFMGRRDSTGVKEFALHVAGFVSEPGTTSVTLCTFRGDPWAKRKD